jgi:Na+-driven multidrug efflux pump
MLIMGVSLYTSRIILNTLGIIDYGLNNVIAGVITLFSFLNGALGSASSRFLTFELGRKNREGVKRVFCTAFNLHIGLAIIIILFCETVGLWMINHLLVIPSERLFACNVIYQCVVISALLSITQVPLNAMIISHERMKLYAYIGISDAALKLIVAYLITVSSFDKLITFGALNLITSMIIYVFYHFYCKRNFEEYNIGFRVDKALFKEMLGYSVWSLLGSTASMLKNQGVNVMINIFFGPVVNAANAIAYQVNSAITTFSNNFTIALNPQIIKSYAANERLQMKNLMFRGGRFSFFLLMMVSIPVLLETDFILQLWLKNVPQYTDIFTRLIILLALIECFAYSQSAGIQATGKIKYYQITVAGIYMLIFPLSYIFYKLGAMPYTGLSILIALAISNIFVRLYSIKKQLGISIYEYFVNVFFISAVVFTISILFPFLVHHYMISGYLRLITVVLVSFLSSCLCIYWLGLKKQERNKVNLIILKRYEKIF